MEMRTFHCNTRALHVVSCHDGTVPVYNDLCTGTVPVYNDLSTGTVPVYNFFLLL